MTITFGDDQCYCKPVAKLVRLISHQITVDITKLTVPTLTETKKIQKTSRASRKELFQQKRENTTTGTGAQTELPARKLESQVRDIHLKLKNVIRTSISKFDSFQAGNIKHFLENWKRITSDKYILDTVKHRFKLDFLNEAPHNEPFRVTYSTKENVLSHRK